jgi:hypothetical protein
VTTVSPVDDPFEREHLLVRDAPVLSFGPRAFELGAEELVRWIGLDLAAGVPKELGSVRERFPRGDDEIAFAVAFFQISTALAVFTEIEEPRGEHRVVEVLGVRGDLRARFNLARPRTRTLAASPRLPEADATQTLAAPETLGNVRVFGSDTGEASRAVASIHRHMLLLGFEPRPESRPGEHLFEPPAADRFVCELPAEDSVVAARLVEVVAALPVESARARPARRLAAFEERLKRPGGSLVLTRYELHRAGTGVLHARRREVESGPERPGLVRTWNLAGVRGGTRVRIREVGGRTVAELGGSVEGVAAAKKLLTEKFPPR